MIETKSEECVLYMAIELSLATWRLAFTDGGIRFRHVVVDGGDTKRVMIEVAKAKRHFGLGADVPIRSGYEAGRDGFWLHRFLTSNGIDNLVMDASSIEVTRRSKQTKSDAVDARKLLSLLVRRGRGDVHAFGVVNVPSAEEEDARQLHRGMRRLTEEMTRTRNQIRALLFAQGIRVESIHPVLRDQLDQLRLWNDASLPTALRAELLRLCERLDLINKQFLALEKQQRVEVREKHSGSEKVAQLMALCGVGVKGAWVLAREFFEWRRFTNRKQVGACAGLTPAPYQSGQMVRDQGITKAGNRRVRAMMIELAWCWLRLQPRSALTLWFHERFGSGKRSRRIGIVALARRLLVALWRYIDFGVVPTGAMLKA